MSSPGTVINSHALVDISSVPFDRPPKILTTQACLSCVLNQHIYRSIVCKNWYIKLAHLQQQSLWYVCVNVLQPLHITCYDAYQLEVVISPSIFSPLMVPSITNLDTRMLQVIYESADIRENSMYSANLVALNTNGKKNIISNVRFSKCCVALLQVTKKIAHGACFSPKPENQPVAWPGDWVGYPLLSESKAISMHNFACIVLQAAIFWAGIIIITSSSSRLT